MPNHGPSRILAWLPWLLATPLAAAAPPSAPSFAEAWYREVMEGNIAQAARDYEQIYLSQPSDKVTDAIRENDLSQFTRDAGAESKRRAQQSLRTRK